jgi:hypothetical protein
MRPLLTTLLLVPVLCSAQEVGLSARANADHVRIGEWVEVQVNGHVSASVDTVAPATRDSLGSFEILSTSRDPKELIWRFRLTTMDSGTVFLPPIPFSYRRHGDTTIQRAYANSLAFQVSGMSIDPKGEIRDIKGPMNGPWKFEDIWPCSMIHSGGRL